MRLFKNILIFMNDKLNIFISIANESESEGDIHQMGSNLAQEIDEFI